MMTTDGQPVDGGGQLAPLSDARLAEIRAIADSWTRQSVDGSLLAQMAGLAHDLLDEVTQRREREAALLAERERLLAVVRAVATLEIYPIQRFGNATGGDIIGRMAQNPAPTLVEQARAALAADAGKE